MGETTKGSRLLSLLNPLHSMFFRADRDIPAAPGGFWALSKDIAANEALWNAAAVAMVAAPIAYMITRASNNKTAEDIEEKSDKTAIAQVNSLRPRLDPTMNLDYSRNLPNRGKELDKIERVQKLLQEMGAVEGLMPKRASADLLAKATRSAALWGAPLTALVLAMYAGSAKGTSDAKKKQAKKLEEEYAMLRKMQDAVDAEMLVQKGLLSPDAVNAHVYLNKEASSTPPDRGWLSDTTELISDVGLRLPVGVMATVFALSALGGAAYLSRDDRSKAKLKQLEKYMMGENSLAEAPQVSLPEELLKKKKQKKNILQTLDI